MNSKPHILVLNSTNPSRLSHLRYLYAMRGEFDFTLIYDVRSGESWQGKFFARAVEANMLDTEQDWTRLKRELQSLPPPSGVLNLSEFCVPLQVKLCGYFKLPGPSEEAALYGRNKAQMRKLLASLGMPVPRSVNLGPDTVDRARELQYPVVIKPTLGGGSTLVRRCESFADVSTVVQEFATDALKNYGAESLNRTGDPNPLVVEEIIGGEVLFDTRLSYRVGEISVESIHHEGATQVLAIHDKPLPANGPHFEEHVFMTPTRMPEALQALAADYVDRIHRRLGAPVLHTEFRTFSTDLVPLEFGVRMGGACIYNTLKHSTGNDFVRILLDLCQGIAPSVRREKPTPTIGHTLWAPTSGRIVRVSGEPGLIRSPLYVEHQIYDDVGSIAKRAPLSSRANGHVIYRGEDFDSVESELLDALRHFEIAVEA